MKKVLIAEDYKPLLDLYSLWLKEDFEVIEAYNGREAVERYKEHNPDLVIIDIRMPIMDGDEAIDEIREYDPDARIVAITAYPYSEEELGVEVVRKGFKKEFFLDVVRRNLPVEQKT
ncbi:MAG: response regulator [Euryarchaeota archaeon]|nr:response regulator [Euryarchaeota archaeon]